MRRMSDTASAADNWPAGYSCAVTCFTGFVGAGKTTIILGLLQQLEQQRQTTAADSNDSTRAAAAAAAATAPVQFDCVWIKNEFGDLAVDSQLAAQSGVLSVTEILNGCLCCTSVSALNDAIHEALTRYHPSRILIESTGSAYPAALVLELKRLQSEQRLPITIDACVCVIDALNFESIVDRSITAKLQAKFTDVLLLNKWELVGSDDQLERCLDMLYDINPDKPKIKTDKGRVSFALIFGIGLEDSRYTDTSSARSDDHYNTELTVLSVSIPNVAYTRAAIDNWFKHLSSDTVYRVKGFVNVSDVDNGSSLPGVEVRHALNASFGRFSLSPLISSDAWTGLRLTLMGDHSISAEHFRASLKRMWLAGNNAAKNNVAECEIRVLSGGGVGAHSLLHDHEHSHVHSHPYHEQHM